MIKDNTDINEVTRELSEAVIKILHESGVDIELGLQSLAAMCSVVLVNNAGHNPHRSAEIFGEAVKEYMSQVDLENMDPRIVKILNALKAKEITMEEAKRQHKELTGKEGNFVGFETPKTKMH